MSDTYDTDAGQEDWSQFPTADEWDAKYPQVQDAPPTATAASGQEDWSQFPTAEEWDAKYPRAEADKPEAEGALDTFGREAAHAAAPAATGILTGAATGALTGAALGTMGAGPIGTMVGGFIGGAAGMLGGSVVGEYAQDALVKKVLGYDDDPQRAANKEAHGVSSFLGGVAPFLGNPALAVEKGAGLAAQVTGKNLIQRGIGSGMMGAFEGGQQAYQGEFHPGELAGNMAVGFAMPNGNRYTRAIHGAGEGIVEKYIPGRPDVTAPNAAADKDDAAASQTANTAAGSATAQPPVADPKGAVGYENSKAEGPKDATKKKSTLDEVFGDTGKKGFSQGDVTADPTKMAAMPKATLAPEAPAPANVGQVINIGIAEAAQPAQPAAPQVHPDVQAAMNRNAEILKQYNGKRQPTEIKQEFERNRQIIFANRGPKAPPAAPVPPASTGARARVVPERWGEIQGDQIAGFDSQTGGAVRLTDGSEHPVNNGGGAIWTGDGNQISPGVVREFRQDGKWYPVKHPPKIVGSPDGTGEVPLAPKVTNTMPGRPQATLAPEQAAMAAKHGENSYLAKPAEPVAPAPQPAAEEKYTPEMQAARLAKIQERNKRPQATLAPAEGAPNVESAPAPRAEAKPASTLAPAEGEVIPPERPVSNVAIEGRSDKHPDWAKTYRSNDPKEADKIVYSRGNLALREGTANGERYYTGIKKFGNSVGGTAYDVRNWTEKSQTLTKAEAAELKAVADRLEKKSPVISGEAAPIVAKPQKGLPNKRLAREDDAMLTKLREMGWNEAADRLEKTPEAERPALRARYAAELPRDRTKEKSDLENKLGKQANTVADRDRQNSAIDAIQKSFNEHAPPENETAKELVDRLNAAVETAHTEHGSNPLHNKNGYRPQKLPNTFNWFRKVQDAAVKRPEYWTQDKIDAFKADENATREASAEYPTMDPKLLEASIEKGRRGGNVADAVLAKEDKAEQSHEKAVVEKTSLERATRAIQELGRYMEGTAEYSELSDKAKKTLDAMPPDVRKAWRDSGEKGADPALKGKVKSWLEDHFSDKPQPFATIDTHEQETGYGRQRERQITSRAELAAVEKPATSLIKGVVEKPKAKEKKPKYDFEGKAQSGKELSPEEAARILKASEEAQARNKSAAAPKPSYDKVEGDKYSPLNVGIKDLLGHLVDTAKDLGGNRKGGLNLDKVGADLKKLFDKFARSPDPKPTGQEGWTIKVPPTYIAKRVTSEPQQAGRNLSDMLNRAGKVDNVIKVHAIAGKEQAHILANTKDEQRQMYDAIEKKNPDLITDKHTRNVFESTVLPVHVENGKLYDWIEKNHPETDIGRRTEEGLHRQSINGGNREYELESLGENADPTAGSSPISTTRRSPVMERQFVALEDADGNRHIVHLKIGENGKPTGEFSVWKGYKNHEMPENTPPLMFEKLNDLYKIGDRTFKMKDATTDEIHDNALGTDNKPMEYQRDAAASVFTANAYLRQLVNHLEVLDEIKNSPEFKKYATDEKAIADKHPDWKQSEVPGFKKYWMDDHVREALEDAYQQGFNDDALNQARNLSRAITQSIFWAPTAHAMNVGVHWAVGRGFKWLPNDVVGGRNYRDLAETSAQAIKSVVTHDKIQDVLHENGAGLIFAGTRAENATNRLAAAVGDAVKKNAGKWEKIADNMGLPVGDLIRGVYKASRTAMWSVNDMFLTQAILEHLKVNGKNIDTASKDEIRAAIAHIERHIPNYRTPSRIISDDKLGRMIAKGMRDPLGFGFGRYRYAVFNSFANMTNAVLHGTKAERIDTAGQMMVMGALAFVVYPLIANPIARLITGNPATEVRGRGPVAPIGHIKDDLFGKGDAWPLIRETISVSPLASIAMELLRGKDFGGRDIVNKQDMHDAMRGSPKAALKAGTQLGGYAAQSRYSPLGTLNSSLGNPNQGIGGGLRDALLDWKTPSDKSQKYDAQTPRRMQKDTVQRNKTKPNLGDKILGGLGLN